jgi:tryptophan-rich sensory protein
MDFVDPAVAFNVGAVIFTALAGAWITEIGPWYRGLTKPSWQPPDWAFGPAWSTIFLCAAWAGVLAWRSPDFAAHKTNVIAAYVANYTLNMVWSYLFFRRRRPDWAMWEIIPFYATIIWMMIAVAPLSGTAVLLLVPYICWVSFATVLNATIIKLNRPF